MHHHGLLARSFEGRSGLCCWNIAGCISRYKHLSVFEFSLDREGIPLLPIRGLRWDTVDEAEPGEYD